jgi:hypothetical protein
MAKASTKAQAGGFQEDEAAGASFQTDNDDNMVINLDEVQEQSFEALPKGTYSAAIEKLDYQLSKSSGKPMWNVQLSVTDGPYSGRKLFTFVSFSEKALPGTKAAIKVIAPNLLSGNFNPREVAESQDLIGTEVRVRVGIQEYEGTDRNRIQAWMKPLQAGGGGSGAGDGFVA